MENEAKTTWLISMYFEDGADSYTTNLGTIDQLENAKQWVEKDLSQCFPKSDLNYYEWHFVDSSIWNYKSPKLFTSYVVEKIRKLE